ncbi:YcaO-like family protein [Paenibacillus polymyxa]|uniref:YcaO-like family protein n=1 Tax=Paenibacillus polymyxa TaxID=1406 RepID=UPI002378A49A|nr:YcaO-like family protein [Paenibacillus polymyxa]WDM20586.1 YcaO-like family protein [Paenibacillus polymyxa]
MDDEGYIGPVGCGAVSFEKNDTVKKAFSESVERRSLLFGAKSNELQMSAAFDLINKKIKYVPTIYTKYREEEPIIDTTGTAVHTRGDIAIFNALTELLEKNSVFLLWYGRLAYILEVEHSSLYYKKKIQESIKVKFFLQNFFSPLNVVICMFEDTKSPIRYKFGIGSDLNLDVAIDKAISEAFFLGQYHDIKNFYENNNNSNFVRVDSHLDDYIEELKKLPLYKSCTIVEPNQQDYNEKLNSIIKNLPKWIENLFVFVLKQKIHNNLSAVKIISKDLMLHVPIKEYMNLNLNINKNTILLTEEKLRAIPDCPII